MFFLLFYFHSDGVLKTYIGGLNYKEYIRSTLSVCGSYVFCGTENGLVNVWQTETGKQKKRYLAYGGSTRTQLHCNVYTTSFQRYGC